MRFLVLLLAVYVGPVSHSLCVISSKANLRDRPSPKGKLTLTVGKYTPLLEVERKGSWYRVKDVDGDSHWVYARLVSSNIQCLLIKTSKANIRSGPSGSAPLAKYPTANRYFAFKKLDSEEEWIQIESPSGRGPYWVHENLVWRALRVQSIGF